MDQGQIDEDSLDPRQGDDVEIDNAVAARKLLKADRARLRRENLNEQFLELDDVLDSDRPRSGKASIITNAIQLLKDLSCEVKQLKAENALLCEESRELGQEKNELREEKASLKSDIQDLKTQNQQTQRFLVPWPSYSFPVPVPMHMSPCSTFIPYLGPVTPRIDQSTCYISGPTTSTGRSFDERGRSRGKIGNADDVATDLELKVPGSTEPKESVTREKGEQAERHH
ncbi:hypothetical protein ACS0TY_028963 [Phlomoides rotata]